MGADRILGDADTHVQNPAAHPRADPARVLAARGWAVLRMGAGIDTSGWSACAPAVPEGHLPHLAAATGLANGCRAVRGPAERERMRRAARIVAAMPARIAELARSTCAEMAAAVNGTLARQGFGTDSRCGSSLGLSDPPDRGERTMSLRAGYRTEVQPGLCFDFMPALWVDDGGIGTSGSFAITDRGAEPFCTPPGRLTVPG